MNGKSDSILRKFIDAKSYEEMRTSLVRFLRTRSEEFTPHKEDDRTYTDLFGDERFPEIHMVGSLPLHETTASGKVLKAPTTFVVMTLKIAGELTERRSKKVQFEKGKELLRELSRSVLPDLRGGFFIFYDEQFHYRWSLIYQEPSGRRFQYSPYRRYTYFVSRDLTNKTFLQRLSDIDLTSLTSIKEAFSVEKVTKEFYQEIANWYFWALKEVRFPADAESEPGGRNIALIRLITRMIFIWFMKHKGIVKPELFDEAWLKNVLKDLSGKESTFYKAILQNLFFATLNTPVEQRKFRRDQRYKDYLNKDYMNHNYFRYHELFKDPQEMQDIFGDIPFLNGGLFECLDKAKDDESNETGREIRMDGFSDDPSKQPYVPNLLFFAEEQDVDLNEEYGTRGKRYKVQGLIRILSSYNFTIDENTPVDEEVALDPELLGRVFENLLASYNPETATTARKATGSYYTPREIVDYMVRESLKKYLLYSIGHAGLESGNTSADIATLMDRLFSYLDNTNPFDEGTTCRLIEAIHRLKLLDPAVGSGAFPIGALHALVHILEKLDPHNERWKAEQIKAVQYITDPKIRQETIRWIEESFEQNELDYGRKLYLIQHCLYGVDIQPIAIQIAKLRCFISLLVDEKVDKEKPNWGIEPLPNLETKFVCADTLIGLPRPQQMEIQAPKVKKLESDLKEIRSQYFTASSMKEKERLKKRDRELRRDLARELSSVGFPSESTEKIASWDPYDTNRPADWFDPEWMFGVTDGFDIVIGNPPYVQLQKNDGELANRYEPCNYEVFDRMGDIYALFYERGLDLLRDGGILCYITSNKWMRAGYGEKLRAFFLKHNPLILIDVGPGVFEHATVDTNILMIQKVSDRDRDTNLLISGGPGQSIWSSLQLKAVTVHKDRNEPLNLSRQLEENGVVLTQLSRGPWYIGGQAEERLKKKIERIGKPLKDWDVKIYYGIKTGLNEAFIITTEKREEILANCKDADERERTSAIIKPILRGRDIKRYYYEWAGLWVIIIPARWTNENRGNNNPEKFINNYYPSLMSHLIKYEQKAKKRDDQGDYWWELRPCIYYPEFEKEKVVWQELAQSAKFAFEEKGEFFVSNTAYLMTGKSLKYILGYLNSKLNMFSFNRWYCTKLGQNGTRWLNQHVIEIPLPPIISLNKTLIDKIEKLVGKIIHAKKQDKNANTSKWEQEIDNLVYQLYNLTPEEIKIIEENI